MENIKWDIMIIYYITFIYHFIYPVSRKIISGVTVDLVYLLMEIIKAQHTAS